MAHELIAAFASAGLPLATTLTQMLADHPQHCTVRRGCGFTQATRRLATRINQPRDVVDAADLSMFANWPLARTEDLAERLLAAGWHHGWRRLAQMPPPLPDGLAEDPLAQRLRALPETLAAVGASAVSPGSRLLLALIGDLLAATRQDLPTLPGMPEKPDIGSCSQAEEYFLEIAHGRIRRGGRVNIIVNTDGRPLLLEKINLGESHSAIVLAPVQINQVRIPPGSLCALRYRDADFQGRPTALGQRVPLAQIGQARFLRLTTLAVAPEHRQALFTHQLQAQISGGMYSPANTGLEQLVDVAARQLAGSPP